MRIILFMSVFLLMVILPQTSFAQKGSQIKREVKIQRKQNAKASKRAAKYGKKRHMSIQDKATRKRMKKNLNDAKKRHKSMSR